MQERPLEYSVHGAPFHDKVDRQGGPRCSSCGGTTDIYRVGLLHQCFRCWKMSMTLFAECFPDLCSVNAEAYHG
jgi:hypothetical protein